MLRISNTLSHSQSKRAHQHTSSPVRAKAASNPPTNRMLISNTDTSDGCKKNKFINASRSIQQELTLAVKCEMLHLLLTLLKFKETATQSRAFMYSSVKFMI